MERYSAAVIWGVVTWLTYGALETVSLTLEPMLRGQSESVAPWHWRMLAEVTAVYLVLGAALGLLFGLISGSGGGPRSSVRRRLGATLNLTAVFLVCQFLAPDPSVVTYITAAASALLLALIAIALRSEAARDWHKDAADPLVVSFVLLGAAWTTELWFHSALMNRVAGTIAVLERTL